MINLYLGAPIFATYTALFKKVESQYNITVLLVMRVSSNKNTIHRFKQRLEINLLVFPVKSGLKIIQFSV